MMLLLRNITGEQLRKKASETDYRDIYQELGYQVTRILYLHLYKGSFHYHHIMMIQGKCHR
jgi:hypothetical protein